MSAKRSKNDSQTDETELLEIIQRRLSREEQVRSSDLREQNETGAISDLEHQELLQYVERVESQDAERTAALIELAQLHQVPLQTLLDKFLPADRFA